MSKFKVGDIVQVYDSGITLGKYIVGSLADPITRRIRVDSVVSPPSCHWVHPQQCRKIVRKGRRRVWVNIYPTSYGEAFKEKPDNNFVHYGNNNPPVGWIEFIEVKKK